MLIRKIEKNQQNFCQGVIRKLMGGLWIEYTHFWHVGISRDNFTGWHIVLKILQFVLEASLIGQKFNFRQ